MCTTWPHGLGSNEYPREILFAIKNPHPISWATFSQNMVTRSTRLLSILKGSFHDHARAHLVINNYEESMGRINCCGYEALRLLSKEFGIKDTDGDVVFPPKSHSVHVERCLHS